MYARNLASGKFVASRTTPLSSTPSLASSTLVMVTVTLMFPATLLSVLYWYETDFGTTDEVNFSLPFDKVGVTLAEFTINEDTFDKLKSAGTSILYWFEPKEEATTDFDWLLTNVYPDPGSSFVHLLKSRHISWLLLQDNVFSSVLCDTSRLVNWLLSQYKLVSAVLCDTSRLVSWLVLHAKIVSAVFCDTSRFVSRLSGQANSVSAVFCETSRLVTQLLPQSNFFKAVKNSTPCRFVMPPLVSSVAQ